MLAPDRDALVALVARATLAPSTHNTQPWRWVVRPGVAELELDLDEARALPAGDPGGRELVMSCGAALLTLRVAAAEALFQARVALLPDPDRPDVLARVHLEPDAVDAGFSALDAAVPVRRTTRHRFADRALPPGLAERLAAEARAEGAHLSVVPARGRSRVAGMVRVAESERAHDPRVMHELLGLAPARTTAALARPRWSSPPSVRLVRTAPMLAVLWTEQEDRPAWLRAGQALQRVLLVAAAEGVQAGFLNPPCQVPAVRARLARLVAEIGGAGGGPVDDGSGEQVAVHPQALLRLGYPLHRTPRSARRPVGDVARVEE